MPKTMGQLCEDAGRKKASGRKYALPVAEVEEGLVRRAEWLA